MASHLQHVVDTFVNIATSDRETAAEDLSLRALLVCCDSARLANGALIELASNGHDYEVTATRADLASLYSDNGPMAPGAFAAMGKGNYSNVLIDVADLNGDETSSTWRLLGAKSLHYFPIRRHGVVAGVLVLVDRSRGERERDFIVFEQGVTDAAFAALESERRTAHALEMVGQLSAALESRVLIEQAKGVVAERYSMNTAQAFGWLRSLARNERGSLRNVADRIVTSTDKSPITPSLVSASTGPGHQTEHP